MQLLDFADISIVIASISIVIGLVLALLQLRDQNRTRQAQLFMEIYSQFSQSGFLDFSLRLKEAFLDHKEEGIPEFWEKNRGDALSVLSFYEGVGVLVKRKLVDINLVADLISGPCMSLWKAIEPWITRNRVRDSRPQTWEYFEYLYHEIQKIPARVATS